MSPLLILLALSQAANAAPQDARAGIAAVMSRPFAFDAATARELCPDGSRLRLVAGAEANGGVDPLGALGSPTPTVSIDTSSRFVGDDLELSRRAASARCIVLEGGTWSEWWRLLQPNNKVTRLGRIVVELHATGGSVIGVGAAGAYLCEMSVLSHAELQDRSHDPHDLRQHVVVAGLGLVSGACFDFAMDGRTTPEPMFDAVRSSNVATCVWLAGPSAWIQRAPSLAARETVPAARVAAPAGGAAYVFDLGAGRRSRESILGGRVERLTQGDAFEAEALGRMRGTFRTPVEVAWGDPLPLDELLEAFPRSGTENSGNPSKAIEWRGKGAHLRLYPDAGTDVPPSPRTRPVWIRFDWIPIASATPGSGQEPQVVSSGPVSVEGNARA